MKHFHDFQITGSGFRERIGDPEEFDAALGRIVLGFSYLEDSVRNVICLLLSSDLRPGFIVGAELGFRQKLDMMGSLFWHRVSQTAIEDRATVEEQFRELLVLCRRSEELRNTHLHSRYSRSRRAKATAKARRGLHVKTETTNSDLLLDVADFVVSTAMVVEEFPLSLGIADTVGGDGEYVRYSLGGQDVAVFRFGEQPASKPLQPTRGATGRGGSARSRLSS